MERKIRNVHVFVNGMVGVFDESGEQVSYWQGVWNDKKQELLTCCDEDTAFHITVFREGSLPIHRNVVERLSIEVVK